MTDQELQERTQSLSIQIYQFCKSLPKKLEERELRKQLFRSATSVAANYRSACRARSRRAFTAKLDICIEECDEVMFWLEALLKLQLIDQNQFYQLHQEANQLLSIFIQSKKTASKNTNNR